MDRLDKALPFKICMTLQETPERTRRAQKEFRSWGWRVPFYVGRLDTRPIRGLFNSHKKCMELALQTDAPWAMVFEDDVVLEDDTAAASVAAFLESTPSGWDMIYLGYDCPTYAPWKCAFTPVAPHIFAGQCTMTHAMIYHRDFMRIFVQYHEFTDYEMDDYLSDLGLHTLVVRPQIFGQRGVDSVLDDHSNGDRPFEKGHNYHAQTLWLSLAMWPVLLMLLYVRITIRD